MFNRTRFSAAVAALKRQVVVVYHASRDPRMPRWLSLLALAIAAYAVSPIDLIPDFIPVLGLLDDLLLVPLGIAVIIRFTPPQILEDARLKAQTTTDRPNTRPVVILIVGLWVIAAGLCLWGLHRLVL